MKALVAFLRAEPAAIGSLVSAAVTLAASFGFALTADQTAAVTAVAAVIVGLVVRSQVMPVGSGPVRLTPADVARALEPPPAETG